MRNNNKKIGEIGERIAIGELSKYGLDIILPMGDNLPFDFIVYKDNKLYKCQVKSTSIKDECNAFQFNLITTNWYSRKEYMYTKDDVDVIICCDLNTIYLFKFSELEGRKSISIRVDNPKQNQTKGINFAKDYIITEERINEVFS